MAACHMLKGHRSVARNVAAVGALTKTNANIGEKKISSAPFPKPLTTERTNEFPHIAS